MKELRLAELLGEVREDLVQDALPNAKRRNPWRTVPALAACLALVLTIGSVLPALLPKEDSAESVMDMEEAPAATEPAVPALDPGSDEPEEPAGGSMPYVTVGDTLFYLSSHPSSYDSCPETFVYGGEVEAGEFAGRSYYVSEEYPQLIYVYTMTNTNGKLGIGGTLVRTEPHLAYLRFVTDEMRGKDFVCVDGQLYTSMWNGWDKVDAEFYDRIETTYGIRMEGDAPEGFASRGCAEFVGWDIWPTGSLSSNTGEEEIYVNPAKPEIVLVATAWHTVQGAHTGFNVYLRYDP